MSLRMGNRGYVDFGRLFKLHQTVAFFMSELNAA